MMSTIEAICPGCGLSLPSGGAPPVTGYFNACPECWKLFTEVLGAEFSNAVLFGQVHQVTVDTYAVQHAGGDHPDKSVDIHLAGLHFVLERGLRPTAVPKLLQRLADAVHDWPHWTPPETRGLLTIWDVALADDLVRRVDIAYEWAAGVWSAWSAHHAAIAALVERHIASSCASDNARAGRRSEP